MKKLILLLLCIFPVFLNSQTSHHISRTIDFPDIPGYQTLACDFHIHTVFSDGSVWPSIRTQEAIKDSLDAIAITDHIEYLPHHDDIPYPDRNRSHEIATETAEGSGMFVINGSEITRSMPPGHSNAIFVKDANRLIIEDSIAVFEAANQQGAFVFWNHPNWTSQVKDGIAKLTDTHRYLIENRLLHGIEVVNDVTYSDEALQIALDNNLAIMGTSDIHGLIDWQFGIPDGGHRPVTLVFTESKTKESLKNALFKLRTVVYYQNLLVGRIDYLEPLIRESLEFEVQDYAGTTSILRVNIRNRSGAYFTLKNHSDYTFHKNSDLIEIKPYESKQLQIKTITRVDKIQLSFEILNAIHRPNEHPTMVWNLGIQED